MAKSVGQDDFGWFTPADLKQVILAIHQLQDWKKVILVGGQSLTAWVEYYKIELPAFEGPYLTADADFLYVETPADRLADTITQLSDDEVHLDEVERLLIALERAGVVASENVMPLHINYLREKLNVRPV